MFWCRDLKGRGPRDRRAPSGPRITHSPRYRVATYTGRRGSEKPPVSSLRRSSASPWWRSSTHDRTSVRAEVPSPRATGTAPALPFACDLQFRQAGGSAKLAMRMLAVYPFDLAPGGSDPAVVGDAVGESDENMRDESDGASFHVAAARSPLAPDPREAVIDSCARCPYGAAPRKFCPMPRRGSARMVVNPGLLRQIARGCSSVFMIGSIKSRNP